MIPIGGSSAAAGNAIGLANSRPAFVVRDRNYVSARWPGDAHTFAKCFAEILEGL